jgi:hypothetical protein
MYSHDIRHEFAYPRTVRGALCLKKTYYIKRVADS